MDRRIQTAIFNSFISSSVSTKYECKKKRLNFMYFFDNMISGFNVLNKNKKNCCKSDKKQKNSLINYDTKIFTLAEVERARKTNSTGRAYIY